MFSSLRLGTAFTPQQSSFTAGVSLLVSPCEGTEKIHTCEASPLKGVCPAGAHDNLRGSSSCAAAAGRCTTTLVSESGVDTGRRDAPRLVVARRGQCLGGRKEQAALSCQGEKNILMVDTFSPPPPHTTPLPQLAFNIQQLSDLMRSFVNGQSGRRSYRPQRKDRQTQ